MSKVSRRLYQALEAKYTADIMDARARLSVYFENSVAIGEHPQHIEECDKLITEICDAEHKINILKEFRDE